VNGTQVVGKTSRQGLSSPGIMLVEDYVEWLHTSP
jgi:hypothetical protein